MMQIVHYHGHTQPGQPTVKLERLEDEMNRYGRVIPTESGSYVINPLCKIKRQTSSDDVLSSMNIDDTNVTHGDGETNYMCLKRSKKNFKHTSEVGMKTVASGGALENIIEKESASLTTSPLWPPLYEDISDSETESHELEQSAQKMCEFMCSKDSMKTVSLNRDNINMPINPENYIPDIISQPKAILTEDVVAGKTGGKRRHSAPEHLSEHCEKRKQKQKKSNRRWSFNSEADVSVKEKPHRRSYLNRVTIERQLDKEYRLYIKLSSSEDESFEDNEDNINFSISIKKEPTSTEDDAANKTTVEQTKSIETKTKTNVSLEDEDTLEAPNAQSTVVTEITNPHLSTSAETTECLSKDTYRTSIQDNGSFNSESCKSKTSILLENKSCKNKTRILNTNSEIGSQDTSSYSKHENNSKDSDPSSSSNHKNLKEQASKFSSEEIGEKDTNKNQKNVSSGKENFEEMTSVKGERDLLKTAVTIQNTTLKKSDCTEPVIVVSDSKSKGNRISNDSDTFSNKSFSRANSNLKCNEDEDIKCTKHCRIADELHRINSNNSGSASNNSKNTVLEINLEQEESTKNVSVTTETENVHKYPEKSNFENDATGGISDDLSTSENKSEREDTKSYAHLKIKANEIKTATDIKKELNNIREIRKRHFSRHPRFSRYRFRHDNIKMFKISPDMPSRSKQLDSIKHKKLNIQHEKIGFESTPSSPPPSSSSCQLNVDTTVVVDIEDDTPSPGSLTIDLDEPDANVKDNDTDRESKENINKNDEVIAVHEVKISKNRKLSAELVTKSCESNKKNSETDGVQVVSEELDNESKEKDCETSDEGQSKKKKKKVRKRISGDPSVMEEVMNQIFSNQMQEKGRRLAQELPRFNWLEEKIRNGGVPKKLSQKRPSTQETSETISSSVLPETSKSSILCQSTSNIQSTRVPSKMPVFSSSDSPKSSVNDPPSEPVSIENRDGIRPPSKKPRQLSPGIVSYSEAQPQEASRNAMCSSTDKSIKEEPLLSPVQQSQRTPEGLPVSEKEQCLQKQQVSRKPVIVSASEIAQTPVVDPLLQQLTSGGELEVTLSMPHCSLSLSDSKVRTTIKKTPGSVANSEITYVSVEPVKSSLKPQENCDDKQGLPGSKNQPRRMSSGVENLPQPRIARGSEMHYQFYGLGREHHQWQNDGPVRTCPEASQVLPPSSQTDRGYSDRITTMARHAAMSFDTGLVGPAAVLEAAHRAQRRQFQRPPVSSAVLPHEQPQQTSDQSETFTPQITGFDSRFQYPRTFPIYMPQQPVRPQVVRPSAHYPPMPPYRSQPAYIQAQPGTNRPCLIPGVPQYAFVQHPGTASVPQKAVSVSSKPVINSSNVQQMISKGPCSPPNEISSQIAAGYPNVGMDRTDICANKAAKDLEMLVKIKQAREEEVHRLNLKKEQAMRALQQAKKQIECLQQTEQKDLTTAVAGQVILPRPAVPSVTAAATGNLLSSVPTQSVASHQTEEEIHILQRRDKAQMPNRTSHIQSQHIPSSVSMLNIGNRKQDSNSNIETHINVQRHETVNVSTGETISTQQKLNTAQRTAVFHHNMHPLSDQQRQSLAQRPNITGNSVNPLEIATTAADHDNPNVSNIFPSLQAASHQKSNVVLGALPNLQLSEFSPGHESVRRAENAVKLSCQKMTDISVGQFTEDEATSSTVHEPHSTFSHNKQQIPPPPALLPRPPLTTAQSFPSHTQQLLYRSVSKHTSHQQTQNSPQLSPIHKTNPPQPELLPVKQQAPSQVHGTTLKSHLLRSSLQLPVRPTARILQTHSLPRSQQHQSLSASHLSSHYQQPNIPHAQQQLNIVHANPPTAEQSNSVNTSRAIVGDKPVFQFNAMPPPPPLKPAPRRAEETIPHTQKLVLPHLPHTKFTSAHITSTSQESALQESKSTPSIINEDHPIDLSVSKQKSSNNSASNRNRTTGESATLSTYGPENRTENVSQVSVTSEYNSPKLLETLQTDIRRMYQGISNPISQEHTGIRKPPVLSSKIQNRVNHPHQISVSTANIDVTDKKSTAYQRRQLNRHEEADSSTQNTGTSQSSHCSQLSYYAQHPTGYIQHVQQPQQLMHMSVSSSSSSPDYQQRLVNEHVTDNNQKHITLEPQCARSSSSSGSQLSTPSSRFSQGIPSRSFQNTACRSYQSTPFEGSETASVTDASRTHSNTSSEVSVTTDTSSIASRTLSNASSEVPVISPAVSLPVTITYYICVNCNQPANFKCSACHEAHYCHPDCQTKHWEIHRLDCEAKQRRKKS